MSFDPASTPPGQAGRALTVQCLQTRLAKVSRIVVYVVLFLAEEVHRHPRASWWPSRGASSSRAIELTRRVPAELVYLGTAAGSDHARSQQNMNPCR